MTRAKILFQGNYSSRGRVDSRGRRDRPELLDIARPIAEALGDALIREGFNLILTAGKSLDGDVGHAAVAACGETGADSRERIRTYTLGRRTARDRVWNGS